MLADYNRNKGGVGYVFTTLMIPFITSPLKHVTNALITPFISDMMTQFIDII